MAVEELPTPAAEARVEAATAAAVAVEATTAETIVENPALAAAADAIEETEELAEDLARAALSTEIGRRVDDLQRDVALCRNDLTVKVDSLAAQCHALTEQLTLLTTQMAEAVTRLPPIVAMSSTPPSLEQPETVTAAIVEPSAASNAPIGDAPAVPAKKRIRFL